MAKVDGSILDSHTALLTERLKVIREGTRLCLARDDLGKDRVLELQDRLTELERENQDLRRAKQASETALQKLSEFSEEQLQLERQVLQRQQIESLDVMARGIAHDFNNLLAVVLGNTCLLRKELPLGSRSLDKNLEDIEQACHQATQLCRQLLTYYGRGRPSVGPLDLSTLVREITRLMEACVPKKVALRILPGTELPPVEADATQIQQVVLNLLINAVEAIGDRAGAISITTGTRDCGPEFLQACHLGEKAAPGAYVFVSVADTGCGMDEETQAKIFSPFFSTKLSCRGLGLATVFSIVRGHRGLLRVESRPGQGTRFEVLLPASAGVPPVRKAVAEAPQVVAGGGLVLVVDDEEDIRCLSKQMIESFGFTVLTAADGHEALRIFRERADEVRCLVLDLAMPGLSGEETFREIRLIRKDVPVLISSGYCQDEIAARFSQCTGVCFVEKPFNFRTLGAKLKETLALTTAQS